MNELTKQNKVDTTLSDLIVDMNNLADTILDEIEALDSVLVAYQVEEPNNKCS